jgi:uncharacterized iron-regulated membrane protein
VRRPLVLWHRWFGLLGGVWLFLIAMTGSVLVFHKEIDHALNPDWFAASTKHAQPADAIVGAALAGRPDYAPSYVELPNAPGEVATVWLARRADAPTVDDAPLWEVMVDPGTAAVLGARDHNALGLGRRDIMPFLYAFHYSLHGGDWVRWLFGLLALAWILDHGASVVLALPNARRWRDALRVRRGVAGHKRVFDLHRAIGLWLLPVTLTLAVSGVYFNLHESFKAAISLVSPVTPRPDERAAALPTPIYSPFVGFTEAVAAVPSARVDGLAYDPAKGLYWLRLFDERDIDPHGRRWVFVDACDGRIVEDRHATSGTAGDAVMAWQFPLHSGKAFGWAGRMAVLAAGLAVSGFVVTGFMMWGRKARARKRAEMARRTRPSPIPHLIPAE